MEFEDFLEPEVAVAAAVVAVIASPQARKIARKGAVYGLAGALMVGDAVGAFARGLRGDPQRLPATTNGAHATSASDHGAHDANAANAASEAARDESTQPIHEGAAS